jgi:hypothetical protein
MSSRHSRKREFEVCQAAEDVPRRHWVLSRIFGPLPPEPGFAFTIVSDHEIRSDDAVQLRQSLMRMLGELGI